MNEHKSEYGLKVRENDKEDKRIYKLKKQKSSIDKMKNKYLSRSKQLMILIGITAGSTIGILFFINNNPYRTILGRERAYLISFILILILILYVFFMSIYGWKFNERISDLEVAKERIDEELEILEFRNITIEQKAEKQFKQHQKELNRYYNENIRHMRGVYNIGIFTISSGLLLIVGTIILCVFKPEFINDYIVPTMGIISGLVSSLIGTLFIKMYTETINTSSKFHDKLVYSNNLHFSNFLIAKVEDKGKREDSICEIVKIISANKNIDNKKEL